MGERRSSRRVIAPLLLSLAALAAVARPGAAVAGCADPFASPEDVLDLHLRMPRNDWAALIASTPAGTGCDAQYPYFRAEFRCGDREPWIPVGVRKKRGQQRGVDVPQKPPIKIDFNRFVNGGSWPAGQPGRGFRKLSLNNGQSDNPGGVLPSLLSEFVSWRLVGRELPFASRVAYARIYVHPTEDERNPTYHGVYLVLEDIDRTTLRQRFGQATGKLVKTTGAALDRSVSICRDQVEFDDGGTNEAATLFAQWLRRDPAGVDPRTWERDTERAVDLDNLLVQEAIRDVLGNNNDTVTGRNKNNYYAFDPAQGIRFYFPWDLDDCFGRGDGGYTTNLSPSLPIVPGCSDVGTRTRCQTAIKPRYLRHMCTLIGGTLSLDYVLQEIDRVDRLLRPLLPLEAPLFGGRNPLDPAVAGSHASELAKIRTWIRARIPEVRRQIQAAGVACAEGCPEGATERCAYLTCAGTRRCQNGRWTACAKDPVREICGNGRDDTCDGIIDEGCAAGDGGADAGRSADAGSADTGRAPDAAEAGRPADAAAARDAGAAEDGPAAPNPEPRADAAAPAIRPDAARPVPRDEAPVPGDEDEEAAPAGCACATPGAPAGGFPALALLGLLALARRVGRRLGRGRR